MLLRILQRITGQPLSLPRVVNPKSLQTQDRRRVKEMAAEPEIGIQVARYLGARAEWLVIEPGAHSAAGVHQFPEGAQVIARVIIGSSRRSGLNLHSVCKEALYYRAGRRAFLANFGAFPDEPPIADFNAAYQVPNANTPTLAIIQELCARRS